MRNPSISRHLENWRAGETIHGFLEKKKKGSQHNLRCCGASNHKAKHVLQSFPYNDAGEKMELVKIMMLFFK